MEINKPPSILLRCQNKSKSKRAFFEPSAIARPIEALNQMSRSRQIIDDGIGRHDYAGEHDNCPWQRGILRAALFF
jgi:hypothetical protein